MAYDRLADAIIKHSKLILVIWIVVLLVAAVPAVKAFGSMSYSIDDMGIDDSESMEGYAIIEEYFPSSDGDATSMPMLVIPYSDDQGHESALELATYLTEHPELYTDEGGEQKIQSVTMMMDTSQTEPREDGSGIIVLSYSYATGWSGDVVSDTPTLRQQIADAVEASSVEGIPTYLTGTTAVSYDMEAGAMEDISHIDVFTILMILILVGLFFRSFITSVMPPATMGIAFAVTMGLIYGLMYVMDIFFITEILLLVSMLGAGCDYCIFILARYREERRDGKDHEAALHGAIKWAGESITISGASVIIGFGALSLCSFTMVSTLGICLALGIVMALFAALTFIPSLINVVGDRLFWPTRMREYREGGKATKGWFAWASRVGHSYFDRSSRFTLKHAKAIVVVAVLVSIPAIYLTATSETSYDMTSSMMTGESEEGMDYLGEYADQGMIYPNYVILEFDEPIAEIGYAIDPITGEVMGYTLTWLDTWTGEGGLSEQVDELLASLLEDENIAEASGLFSWESVLEPYDNDLLSFEDLLNTLFMCVMSGMTVDEAFEYVSSYLDVAQEVLVYAESTATSTELVVLEIMFPQMVTVYEEYIEYFLQEFDIPSTMLDEEQLAQLATYMMVTEGAGSINYTVNSSLGYIGGDFTSSDSGTGDVTFIKISASTHDAAMSQTSMDSISYMQGVVDDFVASHAAVTASWVTGSAVIMYEISEIISGEFTNIEILVVVLIIILLFFVMKSYTIPFRSVLTILMSICWTLAATHLLFGDEVTWLIPLILLVICLGLGMDYDILLTTRIKENVRAHGMSNDEAIHHAVIHSGSVITICGLIMGGAFGTLMLSSMGMLQQFGFALCFAILCDALIVRTYIVPAVMHLLGDWNWKGPRFLDRIGGSRGTRSEEE